MNKIIVYARMMFLKKNTWPLIDSNMGSRHGPYPDQLFSPVGQ